MKVYKATLSINKMGYKIEVKEYEAKETANSYLIGQKENSYRKHKRLSKESMGNVNSNTINIISVDGGSLYCYIWFNDGQEDESTIKLKSYGDNWWDAIRKGYNELNTIINQPK